MWHGRLPGALLAGALLWLAAAPAYAQVPPCGGGPPLVSIRVGPFLQDAEPDSITVVWETDGADGVPSVEYGPTEMLGSTASGSSEASDGGAWIHRATLTGLAPDAGTHYRARTATRCSEVHTFRTPPDAASEVPFRFVAYADSQRDGNNPTQHGTTVDDGILGFVASEFGSQLEDELAFVLVPGDLVQNGNVYSQWKDQFFDEGQALFRHVPLYPVPGNHENNSTFFFQYFVLPENGTAGYLEHWYTKDYGNVRVIGLDSNTPYIPNQDQLDWLDDVLADTCGLTHIDFVVAQIHHPFKSELWTPGERNYTGDVVGRLEQFSTSCGKPSAHLFGHTHAYSRGQSRDHDHFWIDVATAEGNIDYWNEFPNADYPEFQRSFPDWGFVLFEAEAGADPSLRVRRVSLGNDTQPLANVVRDDFTIRPSNLPPATPTAVGPVSTGSGVDPARVRLFGTPLSDPEAGGLLESHYQLTDIPGDYAVPLFEDWLRFENWHAPPGATGSPADSWFSVDTVDGRTIRRSEVAALSGQDHYCWRLRYRDDGFAWSAWSAERCFDTRAAPAAPACSNDLDDDGDTATDFPADPGCASASSDVEDPACDNGVDDDGDGLVDAQGAQPDPDCGGLAWRNSEEPGAVVVFEWQPASPGPSGVLTLDVAGIAAGDPFDAGDGPIALDLSFDDGVDAYTLAGPTALDVVSLDGEGLDGGGGELAVNATGGPAALELDFTDTAAIDFARTPGDDLFGSWVRVGPEPDGTASLLAALPLLAWLRRWRSRESLSG